MKARVKAVGIGLVCLACGLPLVFPIAGVTTGAAGAVGYWMGRIEALLVAGLGFAYLLMVIIPELRATRQGPERPPQPTRTTPTS